MLKGKPKYQFVRERAGLIRDTESNGIIINDDLARDEYRRRKRLINSKNKQIKDQRGRIDKLEADMAELKELVQKLVG